MSWTGGGVYDLEVNGRRLPEPLVTPWRPNEWWSEEVVIVPRALLQPGTNQFRFVRRAEPPRDAEFYRMWFLQGSEKGVTVIGDRALPKKGC